MGLRCELSSQYWDTPNMRNRCKALATAWPACLAGVLLALNAPSVQGKHTLMRIEERVITAWLAQHPEYRRATVRDCDCDEELRTIGVATENAGRQCRTTIRTKSRGISMVTGSTTSLSSCWIPGGTAMRLHWSFSMAHIVLSVVKTTSSRGISHLAFFKAATLYDVTRAGPKVRNVVTPGDQVVDSAH
jgi:hypothetical protein